GQVVDSRISMLVLSTTSTLFPYTTLFRSVHHLLLREAGRIEVGQARGGMQLVDDIRRAVQVTRHGEVLGDDEPRLGRARDRDGRSEEHTSELQSRENLVCRLLLEKKNMRF